MFLQRTNTILCGIAASCLILNGCGSDNVTNGLSNKSTVRFVNATTGGSGSLSFAANSATALTVPYQSYSDCQNLNAAATDFSLTQSGTTLASLTGENLAGGAKYTIISTGSTGTPQLGFLTDSYTAPTSGRSRLRVVNATGSTVNVYFGTIGASPTQPSLASGSATSFIDVGSGQLAVELTSTSSTDVLGTSGSLTLASEDAYTLVFTPATTIGGAFTSFLVPEC